MNRVLFTFVLLTFSLHLFAGKVLFVKPFAKGIDDNSASQMENSLKTILKKKFNYTMYSDLEDENNALYMKVRKCGSNVKCWSKYSEDLSEMGITHAMLALAKRSGKNEILFRIMFINVEDEETLGDQKKVFSSAKAASTKELWALVKSASESGYEQIRSGSSIKKDSKKDTARSRRMEIEKRKRQEALERREREERDRRDKLEEERRRREEQLEQQREGERRKREQEAEDRRRRLEEENKKKEEEKRRLDKERDRREEERKVKIVAKRQSLEKNADKLEKARGIVLGMCSKGDYNEAIKAILKVEKMKCECEEDAKVLALKTQLLAFNKVRSKIIEGIKILNHNLILDNLEAAVSLDVEIVRGGTEFSQKVDKIYAVGYYAKAVAMEKEDNYVAASENYEKCIQKDGDKTECKEWLENKSKLVKKLYDKAKVMKNFNPTKAKQLLRSILKLVTAEHEYYKLAEQELKTLEY